MAAAAAGAALIPPHALQPIAVDHDLVWVPPCWCGSVVGFTRDDDDDAPVMVVLHDYTGGHAWAWRGQGPG